MSNRLVQAVAIGCALGIVAGCKNPDDGPIPYVMPAYPVNNLPPLDRNGAPQAPAAAQARPPLRSGAPPKAPVNSRGQQPSVSPVLAPVPTSVPRPY